MNNFVILLCCCLILLFNQCSTGTIKDDVLVTRLWADTAVTNPELKKAAKENKNYYGRQYSVITDSNAVIYSQIFKES